MATPFPTVSNGRNLFATFAVTGIGIFLVGRPLLQKCASGPTLCPLNAMTGIECPSCGVTRSSVSLTNGDVLQAIHFNPIFIGMLLAVALVIVRQYRLGLNEAKSNGKLSTFITVPSMRRDWAPLLLIAGLVLGWTTSTNL